MLIIIKKESLLCSLFSFSQQLYGLETHYWFFWNLLFLIKKFIQVDSSLEKPSIPKESLSKIKKTNLPGTIIKQNQENKHSRNYHKETLKFSLVISELKRVKVGFPTQVDFYLRAIVSPVNSKNCAQLRIIARNYRTVKRNFVQRNCDLKP